ncbi:methionyl-tRNA formyltransferase [Roseivirga thermotolerans]|uniref:methionyl-tRNA formyltransferase n=1 Tax=Roseivirga thermotolerans TaxID=1758176 RepID=UPI00273E7116|nr:formyltransferase family protein [Roseivirga thermotolerans]
MKVKLFLMNQKGWGVLKALIPYKNLIAAVVSAEDKGVVEDFYEPIRDLALAEGIPFYNRKEDPKDDFEMGLAVGWRWLIQPYENLIVFHDSILPRYRGFAPLVNMLVNGEPEIGVTVLKADVTFDTGPIIGQKTIPVSYPIKIADAISQITALYADLAVEVFSKLDEGKPLESYAQDEQKASYSIWRDHSDYFIDWTKSAAEILRLIDAVGHPYQGAMCRISQGEGVTISIHSAQSWGEGKAEIIMPGKILTFENKCPVVCCGDGRFIVITEHQMSDGGQINKLKRRLL